MQWQSSEWAPFLEYNCVDNDANDGSPAFDHSSHHHHHHHHDSVFGSAGCPEL